MMSDDKSSDHDLEAAAQLLREAATTYRPDDLLKRARNVAGWTQQQAADEHGVARETWAYWEGGDRVPGDESRDKMREVADALDDLVD